MCVAILAAIFVLALSTQLNIKTPNEGAIRIGLIDPIFGVALVGPELSPLLFPRLSVPFYGSAAGQKFAFSNMKKILINARH